jgi:hypothetical protein
MQLDEMRVYCRRRSWEIAGEFVDAGICGAKEIKSPSPALALRRIITGG